MENLHWITLKNFAIWDAEGELVPVLAVRNPGGLYMTKHDCTSADTLKHAPCINKIN